MRAQINLKGNTYGLLTVVKYAGLNNFGNSLWDCVCKCGNAKKEVLYQTLEYGKARSCGQCTLELPPFVKKTRKYRKRRKREHPDIPLPYQGPKKKWRPKPKAKVKKVKPKPKLPPKKPGIKTKPLSEPRPHLERFLARTLREMALENEE